MFLSTGTLAFAPGAALFLFVVLGLGVFISTISQTAGQAIQTAFFFLLPQILLSGMVSRWTRWPRGSAGSATCCR